MQQIKKKQHYVWKKYLSNWAAKQQINTLLKSSQKIISGSLDRVGQQRFFYALEEYTEDEEIILKELVERWSNANVREISMEFYYAFTSYSRIKRALKDKDLRNLDIHKLENQLCLLKANTMEDVHCKIEEFGNTLISVRLLDDLQFLEDNEELFKAMLFVSFQYLRTKSMSETIKPILPSYDYLSEKYLNILPFIYAPAMAYSLTYQKEVKFILYDNQTNVDFITSDQPIINEKKHIVNEADVVAQMDLFYPLTPKVAIVIHYQEQKEKYKYVLINDAEVALYNQLMYKNSHEFLFSTNSSQLKQYL